jgi:hypothetical protein
MHMQEADEVPQDFTQLFDDSLFQVALLNPKP